MSVLTRNFTINRMLANDIAITSIFCKIGKKSCKKCQPESKVFPRGLMHYETQRHTYTHTNSHTHSLTGQLYYASPPIYQKKNSKIIRTSIFLHTSQQPLTQSLLFVKQFHTQPSAA